MIPPVKPRPSRLMAWRGNKKIFISGAVLTVIALISYFLIADDGGDLPYLPNGPRECNARVVLISGTAKDSLST